MAKMRWASTHVRYEHRGRPRDLHVRCPRCGGRALARKDSEVDEGRLIGDMSGTWDLDDWRVRCDACMHRSEGGAYDELPEPYYRVEARGVELWAWNRDHLDMLARLLRGESVADHAYGWFATYARREWLLERNRTPLAREVERLLGG